MLIHVIAPGETLYQISQRYQVPLERIVEDNGLTDPNQLLVGQALIIRKENSTYTVQSGDTLSEIAARFGISVEALYQANNLTSTSVIFPGDVLKIVYEDIEKKEIEINGYVYPEAEAEVLEPMLPQLTYLSIFAYPVRSDGSLEEIADERLIELARKNRVAPMMVIANITNGSFDSDIAHSLLTDEAVQERLIENIFNVLRSKNYFGLDVDLEYLYPDDREAYNRFLRRMAGLLHQEGYILTTAIAPKTSGEQEGLLYEAHDYPVHGEVVDHVILMTYEWGYLWSEAMPVAPIDKVEEVISYAVTVIPPERILMGVPNYGYDFNVPRIEEVPATLITNYEAIEIAKKHLGRIEFDEEAMSPFFQYHENGQLREVHFEDARSIRAKIFLMREYDLGGLSFWTLMNYFRPAWLLIANYLKVRKVI
ncbi:MAG TPA: LysM peptidoglycan-binding domain-containing protein [Acholeplasmataceae bacterium]|nr:LysM peptidoglycan-binding domain-containing protein [Acholeplasmataceae bacterium]